MKSKNYLSWICLNYKIVRWVIIFTLRVIIRVNKRTRVYFENL